MNHTIPVDHLDAARGGVLVVAHDGVFVVDGDLIPTFVAPADFVKLTWLTIQWYDRVGFPEYGWRADSFRAHVLNVVPIVKQQSTRTSMRGRWIARIGDAWRWQKCDDSHLTTLPKPITLPPGEHVNKWAVLLEVEK